MGDSEQTPVLILGDDVPTGAYVLRLTVRQSIRLAFGRFKGGQPIAIAPGDWLYIGSAMGQRGASTLARRLVRHATRTSGQPPHALRATLIAAFGNDRLLPQHKTLRWHIDYLLEQPEVDLTQVVAIRSSTRLEGAIAQIAIEHARVVEPGVGASDAPGQTHLLHLAGGEIVWNTLIEQLRALVSR